MQSFITRRSLMSIIAIGCLTSSFTTIGAEPCKTDSAAQFLESLPSQSALCVVLGCDEGNLPVALSRGGRHVVHGLCVSDEDDFYFNPL